MSILHIEAFSGASGDMFLGALAGLANAYEELPQLPALLRLEQDAEIEIKKTVKNGISCQQVTVKEKTLQHNNHRHYSDIIRLINESLLPENAKTIALAIFEILGKAEAEVHDVPIEKIHFHEVGAIDSIIDIAGAAWLLDKLEITETYSSAVTTGMGMVKTAHGLLPVPAPATKLIAHGLLCTPGSEDGERLTPTGAAIIKFLKPDFSSATLIDIASAYGAGQKNFIGPNVLRLSLCTKGTGENEIMVVQTNLDDFLPEYMGTEFQEKLLSLGALDFYIQQVIMKKGRPGSILTVLCRENNLDPVSQFILSFTSAIGLRYHKANRIELPRSVETVKTNIGDFRIKVSTLPDGREKMKPESEDVLKAALKTGLSVTQINSIIEAAYWENE